MYARGLTVRRSAGILESFTGLDLISTVTDAVMETVTD